MINDKEKRKNIDIEISVLMERYLDIYDVPNICLEIYAQKKPARTRIKIIETIEI